MLPESTVLGELSIVEVYEYYIQPALFACTNRTGQIYLAVWIDDNDELSRWLYVAVSLERFSQIRRGRTSLRSAFSAPEDGVALDVVIHNNPELPSEVSAVPANRIEEAWLPLPGEHLELQTPLPRALRTRVHTDVPSWYSEEVSSRRFDIQANVFTHRTAEVHHYTGSAKPLGHESYERLRRHIEGSTEDDSETSLVMPYQTDLDAALVA